jgi:hypothetical protein
VLVLLLFLPWPWPWCSPDFVVEYFVVIGSS